MAMMFFYENEDEKYLDYWLRQVADFRFWKNSWVKNVALVDSIPQGQGWTPNRGGSGFGKWAMLPQPEVIEWKTSDQYDYFLGSHNGYESLGVNYFREVLFIKEGFWIIRDHFQS